MIVVDTNVWSETLRPEPSREVLAWFRARALDIYMPTVVVHELTYGVALLPEGARRTELAERVRAMISRLSDRILPYDIDTARAHAELRAEARRSGREPSAQDGQVAAHAIRTRSPLATRNVRDFEGLGVELVNPWASGH